MKVKIKFQKRSSVFITIMACAASLLMLVKRFGYPEEELVKSIWISFFLLLVVILAAAIIALVLRKIAARDLAEFDAISKHSELDESSRQAENSGGEAEEKDVQSSESKTRV